MKKLISYLILAGFISFSNLAVAGDGTGVPLKAEKACAKAIDIFNMDNIENLLGISDKKVASFEVVLALPGEIYKYSNTKTGDDFKTIMNKIKQHATGGALLFVDEIKTTTGETIPMATFNLLLAYDYK